MKLVNFYYLDKNTKEDKELLNYFVASTKEENNILDGLKEKHKYASTKVIKDKIYLSRNQAVKLAEIVAKEMGYENNLSLMDHIIKALETGCLVAREKE